MRPDGRPQDLRRSRADLQRLGVLHHRLRQGRQGPAREYRSRGESRAGEQVRRRGTESTGRHGSQIREERQEAPEEKGFLVTEVIRAALARVASELGAKAPFV